MADNNQQPENNEPLENNQWEEKEWQAKMDYAKEVLARQQAEADRSKKESEQPEGSEASQNLDSMLETTNKKLDEDEEAEWAEKLAMAKNGDRGNGDGEKSPEEIKAILKKVSAIDKQIKEEDKKTGSEYMTTYIFLIVLGGAFDMLGVIFDLLIVLSWVNLIIGPIYSVIMFLGIHYANMGISSKEQEQMNLQIALIGGAVSTVGLPSRVVSMLMQFTARRELAKKAHEKIRDLVLQRFRIMGRQLYAQYPPPAKK